MTKDELKELPMLYKELEYAGEKLKENGRIGTLDTIKMSAHDASARIVNSPVIGTTGSREESELRRRYEVAEKRVNSKICEIEAWLLNVDNADVRMAIRLHYIEQKPWYDVALEMNLSIRTVERLMTDFWSS